MSKWLEKVNEFKKEKPNAKILFNVCEDDFNFFEHSCVLTGNSHARMEKLTVCNGKYVDKDDLEEELIDSNDVFIDLPMDDYELELAKLVDEYIFEDVIIISVGC